MQNRLLKVAFFITFTELIMGLIVGAYFKLSYFLAPPKEPSMGAGYGMLFAMLFILIPVVLVNLKNTIKSLKGLYCECLNKQEVSPNEPLTVYS